VKAKHSAAAEMCLDRELLCTMQSPSDVKHRVAQIFELLRDPVYRYFMVALGNRSEAEDLTQEVFLRLCISLHKGQVIGNVRAWVFKVAHNLAIKKRKNESRFETFDANAWESLCERKQDLTPDAENRLLEQEQQERLQSALARLSPQERECLELRGEGLGYREIAEVFGMRTQTLVSFVGRVIHRMVREIYD